MTAPGNDRIAVLGPGGVGGLVAAALARAGRTVTVVAREQTAVVIDRDGLRVTSSMLGDFTVPVRAVAELTDPVGTLIVATKATGLDGALERVAEAAASPLIVVPLLNGIEHLPSLRERFGPRVAAATIRVEAERIAPGVIEHRSRGAAIGLATGEPGLREQLDAAGAALAEAGLEVNHGETEAATMWSKLTRLCPLALCTAAHDRPLGAIRADLDLRAELAAAVDETCAVARADGAPAESALVLAELDATHHGLTSSLQRDVVAGRAHELDAIAGAVVRRGATHRIDCPTVEHLIAAVETRAAAR
ncbi:MAG: ketopantoate reductase family protein [Solirubrobacterales bacterium]